MLGFLGPIYTVIAALLTLLHAAVSTIAAPASGAAWVGAIVLLTLIVRGSLIRLAVKQRKGQQHLAALGLKVNDLKKEHAGDTERLNQEVTRLYQESGANVLGGIVPLLVQLPVFISLYRVLTYLKPGQPPKYGLSAQLIDQGARAQVLGAPLAASFRSSRAFVEQLGSTVSAVHTATALLVAVFILTTYLSQRAVGNPSGSKVVTVALYVVPLVFIYFGLTLPLGVLIYLLTTNLWSAVQSYILMRKYPSPTTASTDTEPAQDHPALREVGKLIEGDLAEPEAEAPEPGVVPKDAPAAVPDDAPPAAPAKPKAPAAARPSAMGKGAGRSGAGNARKPQSKRSKRRR